MFFEPKPSTKIKVSISSFVRTQLEIDQKDYGLRTIGQLCNIIIRQHEFWDEPENKLQAQELYKNTQPLQFNLYQANISFLNFAELNGLKTAPLCRYYFEKYVSMPRCQRELFIHSDAVASIRKAISSQVPMTLDYRGEKIVCTPCFIAFSPSLARAYAVVYDAGKDSDPLECFRTLRITHVQNTALDLKNKSPIWADYNIRKRMEAYQEHFDPYLSYGKTVKVKLTKVGESMFENIVTNRPKCLHREADGTYIFSCTEIQAKHYFAQFLKEAKILEPVALKKWFMEQFEECFAMYKD